MPHIPKEELEEYFKLLDDAIPVTINYSKEEEEQALLICDEYLKTKKLNIKDISPLTIYTIISKLSSNEQIEFIKTNFSYIKEHDEDVFLYNMMAPESLSYYLSYDALKVIKQLDKTIFEKILTGNFNNLINNFTYEEYLSLYKENTNELNKLSNNDFINLISSQSTFFLKMVSIDNLAEFIELQPTYNIKFMNLILELYKDKINTFLPEELLNFTSYLEDKNTYKDLLIENKDKLSLAFQKISIYNLGDYFASLNSERTIIIIETFLDTITKTHNIADFLDKIDVNSVIYLYNKDKSLFQDITLKNWIKYCSRKGSFDEIKQILDSYPINDIEALFDKYYLLDEQYNLKLDALKYIENKYRNNIITMGIINEIDISTSIFSDKFFKNLKELNILLKNKVITKNTDIYKKHLTNFILYLKNQAIINDINDDNFKQIEKLFYQIVMGLSMTIVYEISNIKEIILINRLKNIAFDPTDFTIEQLSNYNIKQHKELCQLFKEYNDFTKWTRRFVLKLMLMIGYQHTKDTIKLIKNITDLEHLCDKVDVTDVKLDEFGNPILNQKIINLLFPDKTNSKIKKMLQNKDNDLYKYFPRLFNEWPAISTSNKATSLKNIIDFLKSDDITLSPKYYRLDGLFKLIGCKNNIVNETLILHDKILDRVESSIPRVEGILGEYSYEVLRLQDMSGLAVGNKTDCCFTVTGNAYSSLKHALTSKNGRILVIKKNKTIIAHSWLWRNGDLLCLDNIEVSKSINEIDFFKVYLDFFDKILQKSFNVEGVEKCIKNITIGYTSFDKKIIGIEKFPYFITKETIITKQELIKKFGNNKIIVDKLPQPIEEVGYSDAKNVQYLIRGTGKINLKECYPYYQDERNNIYSHQINNDYHNTYLEELQKKINSLRYIKYEEEGIINLYQPIDINNLKEAYCNDDWYYLTYIDGNQEEYIKSNDERAHQELFQVNKQKQLVKKI